MFDIYDGRPFFWQWDLNQKMIVHCRAEQVHFCNGTSDCSLVVETYKDEATGNTVANVPNVLLQVDGMLRVYAYVLDKDEKYTIQNGVYRIRTRTKPADYVYTETEVLGYDALDKRLKALEEAGGVNEEQIANAIDKYLDDNNIEVGATQEQAAQIQANKEAIAEMQKNGVGQPGEDGKDGVDGEDGITPHIGDNGNWYLGDTDTGKPSRGATGPQGPAGADGKDGAPGDKGDKGDTGATPNLSIGTVTTLAAGSGATATITGTAENPVLSLGIPKGDTGAAGSGGSGGNSSGFVTTRQHIVTTEEVDNIIIPLTKQKNRMIDLQVWTGSTTVKVAITYVADLIGNNKYVNFGTTAETKQYRTGHMMFTINNPEGKSSAYIFKKNAFSIHNGPYYMNLGNDPENYAYIEINTPTEGDLLPIGTNVIVTEMAWDYPEGVLE